jgi:hypothetical protein
MAAPGTELKWAVAHEIREIVMGQLKAVLERKHAERIREVEVHPISETEMLVYVKPQSNVGMRRCYKVKISEMM